MNILVIGAVIAGGIAAWFLLGKPTSIEGIQAGIAGLTSHANLGTFAGGYYHSPSIRGGNFGAYPVSTGGGFGLEGKIGQSPYANPLPSMGSGAALPPFLGGVGQSPYGVPPFVGPGGTYGGFAGGGISPYGLPPPLYGGHVRHDGYEFGGRMRGGFDPDDFMYRGLPGGRYPGLGFAEHENAGFLEGLYGGLLRGPRDYRRGYEHRGHGGFDRHFHPDESWGAIEGRGHALEELQEMGRARGPFNPFERH